MELQENMTQKNRVEQICVISDALIKGSGLRSFIIWVKNYLFLTTLLHREPFITMCYAINSSPLLNNK